MPSAKTILPSTFNRKITVLRLVPMIDAAGGTGNELETDYETNANVRPISADRRLYYGMDLFTAAYEITLYANGGTRSFTTASLIRYEDMTLQVKSWDYDRQGYKRFITLICVESDIN